MKNFAQKQDNIDFVIHQGADAHLEQVEEPRDLVLRGLVIDHISNSAS